MRILLLSNMYPSQKAPNYGVFVKKTEDILKDDGIIVDRVVLYKETSKLKKLIGYILYAFKFFFKVLTSKGSIVYVHYASQNAKLITFIKKLKPSLQIVLNVHGTDVLPQTSAQEKYQPAVTKLFKSVDHVVVPSTSYEKIVRKKYDYLGPVTVFPSGGVDLNTFYPDYADGRAMRTTLNLFEDITVIGYISRIDVQKGWDILLDAIHKVKELDEQAFQQIRYIFAGSGSQEKEFYQKVDELGLNNMIIKLPMLTQPEMRQAFNAMDAFCFPSFQESLGLVGIEAMACGKPIIASDIPGIQDYVVDSENSLLFQKGNTEMLAQAIITFHKMDEAQRKTLSNNALNTSSLFSTQIVKKQLLSVFHNLV